MFRPSAYRSVADESALRCNRRLRRPPCTRLKSRSPGADLFLARPGTDLSTAGFGVFGLVGPRTGSSSGVLPGKLSGGGGSPGSRIGEGTSSRGLPAGPPSAAQLDYLALAAVFQEVRSVRRTSALSALGRRKHLVPTFRRVTGSKPIRSHPGGAISMLLIAAAPLRPFLSVASSRRRSRLPAASRTEKVSGSGSSLERLARRLVGAVERGAGFRQDRHQRGP